MTILNGSLLQNRCSRCLCPIIDHDLLLLQILSSLLLICLVAALIQTPSIHSDRHISNAIPIHVIDLLLHIFLVTVCLIKYARVFSVLYLSSGLLSLDWQFDTAVALDAQLHFKSFAVLVLLLGRTPQSTVASLRVNELRMVANGTIVFLIDLLDLVKGILDLYSLWCSVIELNRFRIGNSH